MVQIYKHGLRVGVKPGRSVSAGPTFQGTQHIPSFLEFPTSALFSNFLKFFLHVKEHHLYFHEKMVLNYDSYLQEWKGAGVSFCFLHSTHLHRRHIIMFYGRILTYGLV